MVDYLPNYMSKLDLVALVTGGSGLGLMLSDVGVKLAGASSEARGTALVDVVLAITGAALLTISGTAMIVRGIRNG